MDTASVNDNERYGFSGLNAIPMLKYRSLKKIDWAGWAGPVCALITDGKFSTT